MHDKIKIKHVIKGSIADEMGMEEGDCLIGINGREIQDIFDYRFLIAEENISMELKKKDGEIWELEIEKDQYEDIGLEFESDLIDKEKNCTNKCIFCFIDQLPKGLRDSLYFKDDDTRLSFLTGNYVTLTNMKDSEIERIIRYHLSPVNVSVHTTNPELRKFMLNNKHAGNVMERLKKLTGAGVEINCQIVLCRGINDGVELERTIRELAGLYPGMNSISVVPVGLTQYREGLYTLSAFDPEASRQVIAKVKAFQEQFLREYGSRIAYIADEFYIMSGEEIPGYNEYEDFPQIENGVGLIASLRQEFNEYLDTIKYKLKEARNVSIATGILAGEFIEELAGKLESSFPLLKVNVYGIRNDYFGDTVTVTGLVTGQDIVGQLKGKPLRDELLISSCMLRKGEDVFLDDLRVHDIEKALSVKVVTVYNDGEDFINKVLGMG